MPLPDLHIFPPISLQEMEKVRLMNRTDTKFVTSASILPRLLEHLADDYFIQEIDGKRNMPYLTTYYDTPTGDMFYQHQRGKKTRQKIRIRIYEGENPLTFLEIKSKDNKGNTRKKRVGMDPGTTITDYTDFLERHAPYPPQELVPVMQNHFYRITLVNRDLTERITIDTGLMISNLTTNSYKDFSAISIIEWKRDGRNGSKRFGEILRKFRIKPGSFSKYTIGMAFTDPSLRQNRLKRRLRQISSYEDMP